MIKEVSKGENQKLRKDLTFSQIVVTTTAGVVGTGILFGVAAMASLAGPSSWLSWVLGSIFYLVIGLTYAELVVTYPEAAGPSRFVLYTHGWFTNVINSFADLLWYIFIPPIEAFAVVSGLAVFYPSLLTSTGTPTLLGGIVAMILLGAFVPFNYFGVKAFGKSTLVFGLVKLTLYIALAIGLFAIFHNLSNLSYGGFMPFGFGGVFMAIPYAMLAYGGIRVVPDFAEESKNYKKLPLAIILVVVFQMIIYLLLDFAFLMGINWTKLGMIPGHWASVGLIHINPFIYLAHNYNFMFLFIIALTVGIIGPFVVGYVNIGAGSRVLFAQGRAKIMPKITKELNKKYAIPYWSLIILVIVGAVMAFLAAPVPTIYGLMKDQVVVGYLGLSVNPVAMAVTRRQGVSKYKMSGGTIISGLAFIFAALIVFWCGFSSVYFGVIILSMLVLIFGIIIPSIRGTAKRDFKHIPNSIWYIVYIAFLVVMAYIGSDGALNLINFYEATAIVLIVSIAVFYPWGILSGLKQRLTEEAYEPFSLEEEKTTVLQK